MKVCLLASDARVNRIGRAYALWLVGRELGWETTVLVPDATSIWPPLRDERDFRSDVTSDPEPAASRADVLIALKPVPGSFDRALELRDRLGIPLVLDVDDPDFERVYGERWNTRAVSFLKLTAQRRPPLNDYRLRRQVKRADALTVSSPAIHRWYDGGVVVPHARLVRPAGREHASRPSLEVAFVGTVRPHKGIATLREALARVAGATLTITAPPPADATPQERWVGATSLSDGLDIVDRSDVVAVVSSPSTYGRGQLPAKLIDGMLSGRAVVASDLPPARWGLGDAGLLVRPDDVDGLAEALETLRSAEARAELGARARQRAIDLFSVEAVGRVLADVVGSAAGR